MRTDKFGFTHHVSEGLEVVSLDTRLTKAFAAEGVVPSSAQRRGAGDLVKSYGLTAEKAVVLYLMGARTPSEAV